jgi:hypothetical protein
MLYFLFTKPGAVSVTLEIVSSVLYFCLDAKVPKNQDLYAKLPWKRDGKLVYGSRRNEKVPLSPFLFLSALLEKAGPFGRQA